ncbi:type ISP restriction/modification enzyme [Thalassospiraceae bacterium LMO-SO8]|nr:N-6 DNA methylase [Alphaproteobacteria bacterium LMO-S08]WND76735.1 type ISP restriction/modification enzyme [Thalassospiraceae bacterium LMO-SO8]
MAGDKAISAYLSAINSALKAGTATEHTHRPALKTLIEAVASSNKMTVVATNEPKQEACGAPDYVVTANSIPLGHIEAKDVGKDLDVVEKTDQLKRYLEGLPNLILTDYLEFRWYVFGEHRMTATLDRNSGDGGDEVHNLISEFLKTKIKTISSASNLAERMGGLARLMRDSIRLAFKAEDKGGELHNQLKGFRAVLIDDLSEDDFADMYAQTICYGLFAARCNHKGKEPFSRYKAAHELPKTNPFLRKIFDHIAGPGLDERVTWIVDDLVELLERTDIKSILKDFGRRTRREDPVVHFYETFLAEYDPAMRERRGVYYTPEPVVSYIVKSVDEILKRDFKIADGLADYSKVKVPKTLTGGKKEAHKVTILDPATGTGTFLHEVIRMIRAHIESTGQTGSWSSYVSQHLLPRIFGFELLMAPYAVCHMKLGLQLADMGYDFKANERLRVYLTNSLQEAHEMTGLPLFAGEIAREAFEAGEAKQDHPVMVVLGNPPYSGHSANNGPWIHKLVRGEDIITGSKTENYFEVDGQKLRERNPKYLNDDYVKFIRFSQWRIEQTGHGILAFITNHGYLDNPTFRGMRQSLMSTFDDIYVLDLHGNTKKKEKAPDGSADKNVFDIQQGVSIGIFVKKKNGKSDKTTSVKHAELWGSRDGVSWIGEKQIPMGGKYDWLYKHNVSNTKWNKVNPESEWYLFKPMDGTLYPEYMGLDSVLDIYEVSTNGFKTHRDHFAVAFTEQEIHDRINSLRTANVSLRDLREIYKLPDTRDWNFSDALQKLRNKKSIQDRIVPCLYQPLDQRYTYYDSVMMDWPRFETGRHALHENYCIAVGRQGLAVGDDTWNLVTVGQHVANTNLFRRGGIQYFPTYLYPKDEKEDLFDLPDGDSDSPGGRKPNFTVRFISKIISKTGLDWIVDGRTDLKKTFGPENVAAYVYAVLHSPEYRRRYADFLEIDFPRLPLTRDVKLFRALCNFGEELIDLHLMGNKIKSVTSYPAEGDHVVDQVQFTTAKGRQPARVWINKAQYFEGIPQAVWDFHVGGYQVCHKWLKDRMGRELSFDDQQHYQSIVSALARTIKLMADIDAVIDDHGGWPLK